MKAILMILFLPLGSLAQYKPQEKLTYKAKIVSDSATVKGYFVTYSDSTVTIVSGKIPNENSNIIIAVDHIKKLEVRNQPGTTILGAAVVSVLGFTVAAGLTKNLGDENNDGKTSFWELVYTAIEGTTSSNRRRRNTALIAGAAGGTAAMVIGLLVNKKLFLSFPINGRTKFYREKKSEITNYVRF
ncbi:MAG: hypothetical protein IPL84_13065 [Chitinophagaceae bacterium]|nr:hypothetical protein [Chitinophagaceae bacterium]